MNARTVLLLTVGVLATGSVANLRTGHAAPQASDAAPAKEPAHSRQGTGALVRMCYGGLEDGKTIVRQGRIVDAARETTSAGCRIDGGVVGRAPQSPTIAAWRIAVA